MYKYYIQFISTINLLLYESNSFIEDRNYQFIIKKRFPMPLVVISRLEE